MMKKCLFLITCYILISCSSDSESFEENEENEVLYNTEWSSKSNERLKFDDDNSVRFYLKNSYKKSGIYKYDASSNWIRFSFLSYFDLSNDYIEITKAELEEKDVMKVYWHKVGGIEKYFYAYKTR